MTAINEFGVTQAAVASDFFPQWRAGFSATSAPTAARVAVIITEEAATLAGQPITRVRTASKWVIPDCRNSDGGWNDHHAPVACNATGAYGLPDGGPVWRGCNVLPRANSTGAACIDSPTGVVFAGERLEDAL